MDEVLFPVKESRFRRLLCYGGPVLAYAGLIFFLSSLSAFPKAIRLDTGFDKMAHFMEYFFFGALLDRWLAGTGRCRTRWLVLGMSIFIGTIYALGDEWHQSFVPGRDASLWDVLFDFLGVGAGAAAYPGIRRGISSLKARFAKGGLLP
jgi:VanZ family protein